MPRKAPQRRKIWSVLALVLLMSCCAPGVAAGSSGTLRINFYDIGTTPHHDYTVEGYGTMSNDVFQQAVLSEPIDLDDVDFDPVVWTGDSFFCGMHQALPDGQTYTLLSTTGDLTGSFIDFAGRPLGDGSVVHVWVYGYEPCRQAHIDMQIHYERSGDVHSVTATVVNSSPVPVTSVDAQMTPLPTTLPVRFQTNQPAIVTATVEVSPGTTSGTVSFTAGWYRVRRLPCPSQHVVVAADAPATVQCQAAFLPSDLAAWDNAGARAIFVPDDPSTVQGSYGETYSHIQTGSTATTLRASSSGALTAMVTPAYTGPASPTGAVEFLADGAPIKGCSSQPLRTGHNGFTTATCDPSRLPDGFHTVVASYPGDANFNASTSEDESLTIAPEPPPPGPSPSPVPPQGSNPPPSPPPASANPVAVAPLRAIVIVPRTTRKRVEHRAAPRRPKPQPRCKRRGHRRGAHLPRRCRRR